MQASIVVTKWEILVISLTGFCSAASRCHNDVILLPAIRRVSGNELVFQQDSAPAHHAAHMQQLNCCVKKCQTFLHPTCGLQTAQISVLWIRRFGLSCSIVSTTDKQIHSVELWMNWNSGSSMSAAVWTVDFQRGYWPVARKTLSVCSCWRRTLWVQPVNWLLILSISVTFNVTCFTATSLITKSCQQRWPIRCCLFYNVVH